MTDTYGWRSQFWAITAFWAIMMFLLFFANPETTFYREYKPGTESALAKRSEESQFGDKGATHEVESRSSEALSEAAQTMGTQRRQTYLHSLLPFQKIENRSSLLSAVLRFALTGLYPIVWISFLVSRSVRIFSPM